TISRRKGLVSERAHIRDILNNTNNFRPCSQGRATSRKVKSQMNNCANWVWLSISDKDSTTAHVGGVMEMSFITHPVIHQEPIRDSAKLPKVLPSRRQDIHPDVN